MSTEGSRIDPADWDQFSADLHVATDICLDRMKDAKNLPWVKKPEDMRSRVSLKDGNIEDGIPAADVYVQTKPVVCLEDYYSILLLSYSISSGACAIGSPNPLPNSFSVAALPNIFQWVLYTSTTAHELMNWLYLISY